MAQDQVCKNFLKVHVLLFIVGHYLNYNTCQSHPASSPFKKKGFPLYDDLAYLCDNVLTMGASAFWGTGMGSVELYGKGSVEEEGEEDDWDEGRMSHP